MNTLIKTTLLAAAISLSISACSQKTRPARQHIKEVADTIGHKTAELGAKGAAQVTDKVYAGKFGPGGETIYIDKNSKYFYINNKGKRVFIKKSALRDKE